MKMKELTIFEMNEVSGAGIKQILDGSENVLQGLADAVLGGALGLVAYAMPGALQGGLTSQGPNAGIFGIGAIALLVATTWGCIQGGILGIINGAYFGSEHSANVANQFFEGVLNGTGGGYKPN